MRKGFAASSAPLVVRRWCAASAPLVPRLYFEKKKLPGLADRFAMVGRAASKASTELFFSPKVRLLVSPDML